MGEVYRARDTRLDRIVAIKILPNICTLHDVGHQDGIDYLVMEYVEGETLAQRLARGPLPLAQGLQYSIEIADALDKAHRKGVTHRDLKPGNIMRNPPAIRRKPRGVPINQDLGKVTR